MVKFNLSWKALLAIAGIIIIIILLVIAITYSFRLKEQIQQNEERFQVSYKKLNKSLQRAKTEITDKEKALLSLSKKYELDLERVKRDLRSVGGELKAVGVSESISREIIYKNLPSTDSVPVESKVPNCKEDGRPIDVHSYTRKIESRQILDSNGIRIVDVSFTAASSTPWNLKVYGLRYRILNTIGRTAQNKIVLYTQLQVENPEAQPGKIFNIEASKSNLLQLDDKDIEFDWWDPTLYLITNIGIEVYDEINLSLSLAVALTVFSFGDDFKFLGVSAGYDPYRNSFRASLIPFMYNIGAPIPLLSDLYIGLDVGISHRQDVSITFTLATKI
jgi:hypothetical protein